MYCDKPTVKKSNFPQKPKWPSDFHSTNVHRWRERSELIENTQKLSSELGFVIAITHIVIRELFSTTMNG
jgi:hypothetical protein